MEQPNRDAIQERVRKVIIAQADLDGITPDQVMNDTTFASLGCDSLWTIETILALQKEFDIEIPNGDEDRFTSIDQCVDYIEGMLGSRNRP